MAEIDYNNIVRNGGMGGTNIIVVDKFDDAPPLPAGFVVISISGA